MPLMTWTIALEFLHAKSVLQANEAQHQPAAALRQLQLLPLVPGSWCHLLLLLLVTSLLAVPAFAAAKQNPALQRAAIMCHLLINIARLIGTAYICSCCVDKLTAHTGVKAICLKTHLLFKNLTALMQADNP